MTTQQNPDTIEIDLDLFGPEEMASIREFAARLGLPVANAIVLLARERLSGGGVVNSNTGTVGTSIQAVRIDGVSM